MPADRVYKRHLAVLRYCSRGSREFFQKHGLSWIDFLKNGVDRKTLESMNDAMADKAIKIADEEEHG